MPPHQFSIDASEQRISFQNHSLATEACLSCHRLRLISAGGRPRIALIPHATYPKPPTPACSGTPSHRRRDRRSRSLLDRPSPRLPGFACSRPRREQAKAPPFAGPPRRQGTAGSANVHPIPRVIRIAMLPTLANPAVASIAAARFPCARRATFCGTS